MTNEEIQERKRKIIADSELSRENLDRWYALAKKQLEIQQKINEGWINTIGMFIAGVVVGAFAVKIITEYLK